LSHLTNAEPFVKALVAEHPDANAGKVVLIICSSDWKLGEQNGNVSVFAEVRIKQNYLNKPLSL